MRDISFRKFQTEIRRLLTPYFIIRKNLKGIIFFELVYRLLSFLVFFPCLTAMERVLLFVNRKSNIAAFNALKLLINPLTWLVLALMVIFLGICALVEQFGLSDAMHAAYYGRKLSGREILKNGICLTVRCARPENLQILLFVLVILPFAGIMDSSSLTRFFSIPGFITESIHKYWYYSVLCYAVIALLLYLGLRWFSSLVVMVTERITGFEEACRRSSELTGGFYKLRLILLNLFWLGALSAFLAACYGLVTLAVCLLILWVNAGSLTFFRNLSTDVKQTYTVILSFFLTWFSTPFLIVSVQGAYYCRLEDLGEELPGYTEKENIFAKKRWLKPALISLACLVIFVSVPLRYRQVRWMMSTGEGLPMIMAHRGYSAEAPENTLEAMHAAMDIGIKAVEFDVQMTKDGVIVLLHDDSLTRTTGLKKKIWEVTYAEIQGLDASVCFRKETRNTRYPATRIPTLDEVLKTINGQMYCNIEIKRTGHDEGIEKKVVDIIRDNDYIENCDVTSQDYKTCLAVKEANPDVKTAYTTVIGLGHIEDLEAADIISIQESFATFREVQRLHGAGKKIFVWTVNDPDMMEKLISLNVDAILTNDPALGQDVLEKHATTLGDVSNRLNRILAGF